MTRMRRLKRVFAIDIETRPKCGGKLRVIARIENPDVIAAILEHVRAREAATTTHARAPPLNTELPAARTPGQAPVENDRLTPCCDRYPSNRRFARPFRLQRPPPHPQRAQRTPPKTSPERPVNQPYFATIPFRAVIRPIRSLVEFVADRPGHDRRYAIDASRIARELDWRPRVDFDAGIAATVDWYAENVDWRNAVGGAYAGERLGLHSGRRQ